MQEVGQVHIECGRLIIHSNMMHTWNFKRKIWLSWYGTIIVVISLAGTNHIVVVLHMCKICMYVIRILHSSMNV